MSGGRTAREGEYILSAEEPAPDDRETRAAERGTAVTHSSAFFLY